MTIAKTFKYDHIVRDVDNRPLGRIVLIDNNYVIGESLKVLLLKLPKVFFDSVLGAELYIDGIKYRVPYTISDFRINKTKTDWIVSNFVLELVN